MELVLFYFSYEVWSFFLCLFMYCQLVRQSFRQSVRDIFHHFILLVVRFFCIKLAFCHFTLKSKSMKNKARSYTPPLAKRCHQSSRIGEIHKVRTLLGRGWGKPRSILGRTRRGRGSAQRRTYYYAYFKCSSFEVFD